LLRLLLHEICVGFLDCSLRLRYLRLRLLERLLDISGIHYSEDLPCCHHVSQIGTQFRDSAGKLRVNVDLIAAKPAIAPADASGQLRLMLFPPIKPGSCDREQDNKKYAPYPQPPPRFPCVRQRHRRRQFTDGRGGMEALLHNRRSRYCTTFYRWIFVDLILQIHFLSVRLHLLSNSSQERCE
jgi:hypothetical protein